jgi:hypothetical protein
MNELQQVWRERVDWVQASGLTIAAANAELGVSAASVHRWKRLLAESQVSERHPAGPGKRTAGATKSPGSTLPFIAVQVRDADSQVNPWKQHIHCRRNQQVRGQHPRQWRVSGAGSTQIHHLRAERPAAGALATVSQWIRGPRARFRHVLRQFRNRVGSASPASIHLHPLP